MYRDDWDGDELLARVSRAIGRADIAIAERIGWTAKEIVHVESGTLRRSIHAAPAGEFHGNDEVEAHGVGPEPHHERGVYLSGIPGSTRGADLMDTRSMLLHPEDATAGHPLIAVMEVGSWVAYACVEETGRHHYYMHPAYEMVAPTGWETIAQAFAEEGLV